MEEMIAAFLNMEDAYHYVSFVALAFMLEAMIIMWLGKKVYDLTTSFSVDRELTSVDNKALAVSFSGYLIGQGVIIWGVMQGPAGDWGHDMIMVGLWSIVGVVLLNLARVINDRFVLHTFSNRKEIIEDKNVGVGAAQAGAYIGSAFLIEGVVAGEQPDWIASIIGALVFFILGQVTFILFSIIYQKVTRYDIHAEMERDNIAAGVSFGLTLVAVGILLSNTIQHSMSIPAYLTWFVNGVALILITRILVDKMILPNHKLDEEIATDQNWGVALVEGGCAIMVAFLLNASFA